jgi:hypothetical protein
LRATLLGNRSRAVFGGTGEGVRESTFSWSNALSLRVAETTFVDAEVRYVRAYNWVFLNRFEGHALYLGPTLHQKIGKGFITLAYSGQVAGEVRDPGFLDRAFNLTHFERHAVRIKVGMEF